MKYIIVTLLLFFACGAKSHSDNFAGNLDSLNDNKQTNLQKKDIPAGLQKLLNAYPDFLDSADENNLYWKDGTVMIYDDGKEKTFDEMLDNPDLEDMFKIEYPIGEWNPPPGENFDPGRIRYEPFFMKMYGNSSGEVKGNLVTVDWMQNSSNERLQFSNINQAYVQLKAVSDELEQLPDNLKKYVIKTAGTFNWRPIAGTNRYSAHSFGIAIDINTSYSDYWLWDKSTTYRNQIPMEIVQVFEKYGFIWGGKWYHYDTMHFEYRPELFVK